MHVLRPMEFIERVHKHTSFLRKMQRRSHVSEQADGEAPMSDRSSRHRHLISCQLTSIDKLGWPRANRALMLARTFLDCRLASSDASCVAVELEASNLRDAGLVVCMCAMWRVSATVGARRPPIASDMPASRVTPTPPGTCERARRAVAVSVDTVAKDRGKGILYESRARAKLATAARALQYA